MTAFASVLVRETRSMEYQPWFLLIEFGKKCDFAEFPPAALPREVRPGVAFELPELQKRHWPA
jgi:hypothetical protein